MQQKPWSFSHELAVNQTIKRKRSNTMSTRVSNEPEDIQGINTTLPLSRILIHEEENLRRVNLKAIPALAKNIAKIGLLQNLVVSEIPAEQLNGGETTHILRAGYRRAAALESLGSDRGRAPSLDAVPVLVIPMDVDPMSVNMSENAQREDVNYIDLAKGIKRRMDAGAKVADIAADLGKTVPYVHQVLPMIDPEKIRPNIQKAIAEGKFTFRVARVLPSMNEAEQDKLMADVEASGKGGSTDVVESAVRSKKKKTGKGRKAKTDKAEGSAAISTKKAILLIEETEGELLAASRAEEVTDEDKAAYKEAIGVLRVFGKFLSGKIGAPALGKQLTKKMAEE
jgi:ParB/RepB/Spo0J family partition protein